MKYTHVPPKGTPRMLAVEIAIIIAFALVTIAL